MLRRVIVLSMLFAVPAAAQEVKLTYRGCVRLSDPRVIGLSGITRTAEPGMEQSSAGVYWGVMDSGPVLVKLSIKLKPDGSIGSARASGFLPILAPLRDLEGIAFTNPRRDSVIVSDETSPGLTEVSLSSGKVLQALTVPPLFKTFVPNKGFESCTLSPDGKTLWTANERALKIDGNPQTPVTPIMSRTRVRLLKYDVHGDVFTPVAQYEYDTSGVHDWAGQIGLCDLAALGDGRLLALERSAAENFSGQKSIRTRIFLIAPPAGSATDISKPPFDRGLVNQSPIKVHKTMLFDGFVCSSHGENMEGLCLGPRLGPNRRAIFGVVDNTDGPMHLSKSSVVVFTMETSSNAER